MGQTHRRINHRSVKLHGGVNNKRQRGPHVLLDTNSPQDFWKTDGRIPRQDPPPDQLQRGLRFIQPQWRVYGHLELTMDT